MAVGKDNVIPQVTRLCTFRAHRYFTYTKCFNNTSHSHKAPKYLAILSEIGQRLGLWLSVPTQRRTDR